MALLADVLRLGASHMHRVCVVLSAVSYHVSVGNTGGGVKIDFDDSRCKSAHVSTRFANAAT